MPNAKERIEKFKIRELRRNVVQEGQGDDYEAIRKRFQTQILPYVRQARASDYSQWLKGYMEAGGEPTHNYDYELPGDFYVAMSDFKILPLYGAQSVNVIVSNEVIIDFSSGLGHCSLFFMDNFNHLGSWIPIYTNLEF